MPGTFPDRLTIGFPGAVTPPFSGVTKYAQRIEALGGEAMWYPDHLMGFWPESAWTPDVTPLAAVLRSPHTYLDPFIAIAGAATSTSTIKLGTAVTQVLGRHPAHLAQLFLSLSHLSGGRVILGIGAGEGENLTPYGIPYERPAARVAEALQIIRLLWEHEEPVSFDGEFWPLRDAVLALMPDSQAPAPPIWLAAAGPAMLKTAGRYADGWLPFGVPSPQDYRRGLAVIEQAAKEAGRSMKGFVPALWAYTVIHEHAEDAERILDSPLVKGVCLMLGSEAFQRRGFEHPLGPGFQGWRDYIPTRIGREQALAAMRRIPLEVAREFVLAGTPESVTARLRELEEAGLRHAVLWNVTFFADTKLVGPSYELMANLPFVRRKQAVNAD
ncbi:MAG: LLM class flavin-dependent oxidoreductase [Chloroflexota bacterium]|nr:LLM class flavin-dependent oxidoreductase [Chloroflexota bacterium]